ncbi:MAG: aminoacetone oxidase family FAD-binding enzyme [Candidatus Omnitrophica bacterium]|nr:aminoacetone oxidase family FAD-binding enzyme [Candidatus Omnitrophota bacterium]MDD5436411.1 aminoacetone oxidase family FAD-binding enzyme [Candidatus Omnitrophota bacterium]
MAATAHFEVAVIGGGAAGIVAAIASKCSGRSVVICERLPRLGKKILASGNGRCNLLNENLSEFFYNPSARHLVKSIFSKFGKPEIATFFKVLGLHTYCEEGRIFPATNQSSSVLKVLEMGLKRLSVPVEYDFQVENVAASASGFLLSSASGRKVSCSALIIASGGKSYPALGSDGSCYKFAGEFGHAITAPVPAAVPLTAKDPICHILQGQKIFASAKAVVDGNTVGEADGEVLFTKYGLSGTAILDISRDISVAVNRLHSKSAVVVLDMTPFMDEPELRTELARRLKDGFPPEELIAGILPNKFGAALAGLLETKDAAAIAKALKSKEFTITGTRGWNEADFTAGGVAASEIEPETMESRLKKGLYFAGEIVDVDGCRGGYNLAWAWASGYVAGQSAAGRQI